MPHIVQVELGVAPTSISGFHACEVFKKPYNELDSRSSHVYFLGTD